MFVAILHVTGSGASRNFLLLLCCFVCYRRVRGLCRAGGGGCRLSLHTAITPVLTCTMTLFTTRFTQTFPTGVPWFFIRVSRPTFFGFGFRLWPLSSNPHFASSTISRLRARTTGPALMTIPIFLPRYLASVVTFCVTFRCGYCFCDIEHDSTARILLCRTDFKDASRQVPV